MKTRDFPAVCSEKAAQRGERQRQSVGCGTTEAACRRCAALCAAGRQAAAVVPGGARSAPVRWRAQCADTVARAARRYDGARSAPVRRRSRFPSMGRRAQKKKRPMLSHETLLPPTDLWSGTNPPGQASHLVS
ncbi:MAG: hypothetical protein SOX74_07105 [Candidatus Faecousia sp.]|uniref:hypothetical protein n=1 Tax=Faecousia sp. TaxID=2952921 RepID=UPI002A8E1805|nr:hypothetical protein [Candidatus Faecousia sp.]